MVNSFIRVEKRNHAKIKEKFSIRSAINMLCDQIIDPIYFHSLQVQYLIKHTRELK